MSIKKIIEKIEELAMEDMTEDGIHHDDFGDADAEYIHDTITSLIEHYEYEN